MQSSLARHRAKGLARWWPYLFAGVALLAVLAMLLTPRVGQDPAYHQFADRRTLFGIANFWDVVTSVPLTLAGLLGLRAALAPGLRGGLPELRACYLLFFAGLALIGPGSVWYHLAPGTDTLLWDRLPMSVAFTAFLAALLGEKVSPMLARRLLWPLVLAGLASVLYWYFSERAGSGDLRPYALVQLAPMLALHDAGEMILHGRVYREGSRAGEFNLVDVATGSELTIDEGGSLSAAEMRVASSAWVALPLDVRHELTIDRLEVLSGGTILLNTAGPRLSGVVS